MVNTPRTVSKLIKEISLLKQRIQELEQAEEAKYQVQRALDKIIEFLPDATFVIDADGRVISWNNAIEQMTGASKADMIGRGNYEYAIPFYGERRPLLIDLVLLEEENFARNHYEGVYRQGDTLYAEVYVPQLYKGKGASVWGTSSKLRDTFGNIFGAIESIRDITEQKQREEELCHMNIFLDSIVENIPNMIFLKEAKELRFVRLNRAGEELLGHPRNDVLGKNDYDFFPKEQANFFTQKDREVLRGKDVVDIPEETIQTRFQGERTLHTKKVPILNNNGKPVYLLGISEDITSRKQAEEAIAKEREKLRTLSDNAPFGMVLIDKEGHFTYINRKFTELFGYNLSEIPDGRTWFGKAYPDPKYRHMAISTWIGDLGDDKPGDRKPRVFTVACKDGTQRIVQIIASVLSAGDYLMTCEDITELRKLENQLRQSQKMEAIGTLAGGIAHDFNNVLTGIIGFTEMIYEDLVPDSSEYRRLGLVLKGAYRGRDLVRQILTFSRQTEQDRKPLALNQTIEEGLKFLRPVLPSTIQIVSRSLTDDDMVLADPVQIHQVLMNLCTNAAHAMHEKGGVLDICVSKTSLSESDSPPVPEMKPGEYIVLEVRDTGCGMTSENLERMFDPFFTTKKQGEGTGLGLSVVHGILKRHGGSVTVESEPGKGTVFYLYFPKVEKQVAAEEKEVEATTGNNERILIVDDEDILIELNKERLSRLGYEVVATTSSVDALNIFRKEPDIFDLVITDQTMPHLTGMDLAAELLKIRTTIPIILCTGHNETVSPERVKEAGIREFLMKPLGKQKLAQAIRRVLDANAEG